MAYNLILANRIHNILEGEKITFSEKKMFGGVAFMVNDKMACGVVKDELMLRVIDSRYEKLLQQTHVRPMDFTGRPMRGFLFVANEAFESDWDLNQFIEIALEFANQAGMKPKKVVQKKSIQ